MNLAEKHTIAQAFAKMHGASSDAAAVLDNVYSAFKELVESFIEHPNRRDYQEHLQPILMRLCARYLILEKRRKKALDPVANFHIRNGAVMHRLNWMGDLSKLRMQESAGIMVNYLYPVHIPGEIRRNSQRYMADGTIPVQDCGHSRSQ